MNIHAAIKASKLTQLSIQPSHKDDTPAQPHEPSTDDSVSTPSTPKSERTAQTSDSKATIKRQHTPPDTKPMFKSVDVSIAGTPHRITCPSDEVGNLESACEWINDKIREIRHAFKSKSPSNEELLVLTCLELYDQVQTLKRSDSEHQQSDAEAKALIDKMIKDIRTSL